MQNLILPDTRLRSAVPYLKRGGSVIDVGTDHAYLPIYLVSEGISSRVLACDINRGPILSACKNIAAAGLADKIDTLQTDGLHGTESFGADDVMVFGMGGDLIVRIHSEAEWIRQASVGLILQPMTRAATLRAWLLKNAFEIVGESITYEDKFYQTIAARYCGKSSEYSPVELLLGRCNLTERPLLFEGLVRHEIRVLNAIVKGKSQSLSADVSEELSMIAQLEELL